MLDTFMGGMGVSAGLLVTMILWMNVTPAHVVEVDDKAPLIFTIAWGDEPVAQHGLGGTARLQMRVVNTARPDEYYTADDSGGIVWNIVEARGGQSTRGAVTAIARGLPARSSWSLQVRVMVEQPGNKSFAKGSATKRLLDATGTRWVRLADGPVAGSPDPRAEIQADCEAFVRLFNQVIAFRTEWEPFNQPPMDWRVLAGQHKKRIELARTHIYDPLRNDRWYLEQPDESKSGATTRELFEISGTTRIKGVQLEENATVLCRRLLEPSNVWLIEWVEDVLTLCKMDAALNTRVTLLSTAGPSMMDEPFVIGSIATGKAPVTPPSESGNSLWREVAMIRVDGQLRVDFEPREMKAKRLIPSPAAPRTVPPVSEWEKAVGRYYGSNGDADRLKLLKHTAAVFDYFETQHMSKGNEYLFKSNTGDSGSVKGEGISGLALMALIQAGHGVGQKDSQYHLLVDALFDKLVETSLDRNGRLVQESTGGHQAYHQGFATLALAVAYPTVAANDPTRQPAAWKAMRLAAERIIEDQLDSDPNKGGWDYIEKPGATADLSVIAVQVKALSAVYGLASSGKSKESGAAEFADDIKECLKNTRKLMADSRKENNGRVFYIYKVGSYDDNDGDRLPGCVLAEYLSNHVNPLAEFVSVDNKHEQAFQRATDPAKQHTAADFKNRNGRAYYRLFYRAQLAMIQKAADRRDWTQKSRASLANVDVNADAPFGGNVYDAAMALLALTVPRDYEHLKP